MDELFGDPSDQVVTVNADHVVTLQAVNDPIVRIQIHMTHDCRVQVTGGYSAGFLDAQGDGLDDFNDCVC
jgi:hypothetical protein